jgi:hypothetical protein
MPSIGGISTIAFRANNAPWEAAFTAGLGGNAAWYVAPALREIVGFGQAALQAALTTLNGDNTVSHIVVVGGVSAAKAAWSYGQNNANAKPFFCLAGGTTPDFPGIHGPASFYGGMILESFGHNADRLDHLKGRSAAHKYNFQNSEIALLVNPDSPANADEEKLRWPRDGGTIYEANNLNTIQARLADFAASAHQALIISADPLFTQNMDDVIQGHPANKHVCYPFQDYGASAHHPPHGRHTLHGPSLSDAYSGLGQIVAAVISSGAPPPSPRLEPGPVVEVNDP